MKKFILFLFALAAATAMYPQSQLHVFEDWTGTAGTQNFFYKNVTKTDGSGNVYVAGATVNGSGTTDILVAKYNSAGTLQWTQQYNGLANYYDFATALVIDGSNNVFVTGAVSNDTLNPTINTDVILLKYNSSGVLQWVSTYAGPAGYFDAGTDLYVTSAGVVALTGSSMNSSFNMDYVTILYNSSGVQQWATVYDHSSHLNDVPVKISRKGSSIVVGGAVQTGAGSYDWAVLQYNASGVQTAFTSSTGGSPAIDSVFDMMEDASGNIYIAGSTLTPTHGYDYDLVKLDSNLVIQWEKTYDGAGHLDDVIRSVKADAAGNVYVTGLTTTTSQGLNYLTQKYNSAGTLIWSQSYNDSLNGDDEAHALVLDNAETSLYVTGFSYTDSLNGINYYTLKYDSAGTQQWAIPFDGDKHLRDKATNIAIDTTGNVIVTGESEVSAGTYEYATVRYVEKQTIVPTDFNSEPTPASFLYYANKGQLISTDSTLVPDVRFYTNSTYPAYYFKDDTLSMVFSSIDTIAATDDTLHRIDLSFPSCNKHLRIYPLDEQSSYLNYFLGHCPQGITEIHGQQRLVIHDLYDHIDLVYSSNPNGMKYYFIVKPGGDPDDIHLKYSGASSTGLSSNNLTINSLVGRITLDRPFTYQLNSSNDTIANSDVYADWHSNGSNDYDFDLHPFDSTKVLVIEVDEGNVSLASTPNIQWSTFFGNGKPEDIKTDNQGKQYLTGYVYDLTFPAFNNFSTYKASNDAFIAVFNKNNTQKWATFFGGTSTNILNRNDYGRAIDIDINYNVYVVGDTWSDNLPTYPSSSPGSYNQSLIANPGISDNWPDLFIIKLDPTGGVSCNCAQWATYFGGVISEYSPDIKLDKLGHIYITGQGGTTGRPISSQNMPTRPLAGAYNNDSVSGSFILKFSIDGIYQWGTFFSDSGQTKISAIDVDIDNNIYVTGETGSTGFPIVNPGANSTITGAFNDAFLTKFDPANVIEWSTFIGGNKLDYATALAVIGKDVYVSGNSKSDTTGRFPIKYNTGEFVDSVCTNTSSGKVFISRFDALSGALKWSTYYGGAPQQYVSDICGDAKNNLYITGNSTSSGLFFPSPNLTGAYVHSFYGGTNDAFILGFNKFNSLEWATYLGGNSADLGNAITAYKDSTLYLTGTGDYAGTTFPTESGSGSPTPYFSTTGSMYITKFDLTTVDLIGINELAKPNSFDFTVYPNPSNAYLNISVENKHKEYYIRIYNSIGQEVFMKKSAKETESIELTDLNSGIYIISINYEGDVGSKKIIVQK